MKRRQTILTVIASAAAFAVPVRAEEAGSGHYMPGTMASFVDAFPAKAGGFALLNYFTYYDASAGLNRTLPFHGYLAAGVDATLYADTITGIYQTPWTVFGGGFALGAGVPYVWMELEAQAQRIGPTGTPGPVFAARDTANGIGDIMLIPYMIGWTNLMPDLKVDTRMTVFAPTGSYDEGNLANIGKNYWTFEPGLMISWLSSKIGTEATLYSGVDFNTKNEDTDYQSGTSIHFDLTLAQHLPLFGGFVGLGGNAFYYDQVSGDRGSGARLGDFEGRTAGVGPVLSYVRKVGKRDLLAEIKWLPELETENRLEGDFIWFKLGLVF